jgi:hypothetical protein
MLLGAIGHEKPADYPLNPVIPVQYSGEAGRPRGALAFGPSRRNKLLNSQRKISASDEGAAPVAIPLVNVTKT